MISMMLFYSCTCTTNRTGETKVQWNPHNTHMQTQMRHSTIVCITGPQKKCRRHCFIDYVNPFAPGDFAEKRVLKLVEWFSGHCCAIKS